MQLKTKDDLHWLQFDLLSEFSSITHGVFLRHGNLNLSNSVGDDPENVAMNRKKIQEATQLPTLIFAKIVHGADVCQITTENSHPKENCDALMTDSHDMGLMITHADCQAAIFYDPVHHAIANVHSGWRGNVQNIYATVIKAMHQSYGSKPQDLLVCISPSLGPHEAEFIHYKTELPEEFWDYQIKPTYFDFWAISKMQLQKSGVLLSHIEIAAISTYAHPQDYFSYRRDRITGRNGTLAALKKKKEKKEKN